MIPSCCSHLRWLEVACRPLTPRQARPPTAFRSRGANERHRRSPRGHHSVTGGLLLLLENVGRITAPATGEVVTLTPTEVVMLELIALNLMVRPGRPLRVEDLAVPLGIRKRSTRALLAKLEVLGLVTRERRPGDVNRFNLDGLWQALRARCAEGQSC